MQRLLDHEETVHQPQWVRPTEGEPLWPVALAVVVAAGLQLSVPTRLALHPRWLLPALVLGLLIVLAAVKPAKVRQGSVLVQIAGLLLVIIAAFQRVKRRVGGLCRCLMSATPDAKLRAANPAPAWGEEDPQASESAFPRLIRWFTWPASDACAIRMSSLITTLNPTAETINPARLVQSPTLIVTGSSALIMRLATY